MTHKEAQAFEELSTTVDELEESNRLLRVEVGDLKVEVQELKDEAELAKEIQVATAKQNPRNRGRNFG